MYCSTDCPLFVHLTLISPTVVPQSPTLFKFNDFTTTIFFLYPYLLVIFQYNTLKILQKKKN